MSPTPRPCRELAGGFGSFLMSGQRQHRGQFSRPIVEWRERVIGVRQYIVGDVDVAGAPRLAQRDRVRHRRHIGRVVDDVPDLHRIDRRPRQRCVRVCRGRVADVAGVAAFERHDHVAGGLVAPRHRDAGIEDRDRSRVKALDVVTEPLVQVCPCVRTLGRSTRVLGLIEEDAAEARTVEPVPGVDVVLDLTHPIDRIGRAEPRALTRSCRDIRCRRSRRP